MSNYLLFQLILAYVSLNGFLTGYYYGSDNLNLRNYSFFGKLMITLLIVLGLLFYIPILIILLIASGFGRVGRFLNEKFQVTFFFTFYFTKKWDNLDKHILLTKNRVAKNRFGGKSMQNRIYRYCQKLINERNNYTYVETTEETIER